MDNSKKTIAYIAHQIKSDTPLGVSNNIRSILKIIREINLNEPNVIPFAPYLADVQAMDDSVASERSRGVDNGTYLLKSGMIDEVRLYGPSFSEGMRKECEVAINAGATVVCMSDDIATDVFHFMIRLSKHNMINKSLDSYFNIYERNKKQEDSPGRNFLRDSFFGGIDPVSEIPYIIGGKKVSKNEKHKANSVNIEKTEPINELNEKTIVWLNRRSHGTAILNISRKLDEVIRVVNKLAGNK